MHFHQEGIAKLYSPKLCVFNSVFEVRKSCQTEGSMQVKNKDVKQHCLFSELQRTQTWLICMVRYREKLSGTRKLPGMDREVGTDCRGNYKSYSQFYLLGNGKLLEGFKYKFAFQEALRELEAERNMKTRKNINQTNMPAFKILC